MKKVLVLFGTRPECIKLAPVVRALKERTDCEVKVCFTGQHRQMAEQVFRLFELSVDWDLDLMTANQSLAGLTARAIAEVDRVFEEWMPDWVVVQGDTTTAMVGALTAFYRKIKVAHVEAGLRTGDMGHPFPEEFNRRAIDLVATIYFAPTAWAAENLYREGVSKERVVVCGNTGIDALLQVSAMDYCWDGTPIEFLKTVTGIVLVTAHRRESFGKPFENLCHALRVLADQNPDRQFVYPVHLNPNVQSPVRAILGGTRNLHLLEPVDYFTMVQLLKKSRLVLTDSGGIQEEAPSFGIPILVMRETTERPEAVEAGFARVVGTSRERIIIEAQASINKPEGEWNLQTTNPYGTGDSADTVAAVIGAYPCKQKY
ncbi:MAG: UDP-N-acetylglucosamine 2-epimerase (non-hydrolyzing) [Deltaproteobacteria bacterium]